MSLHPPSPHDGFPDPARRSGEPELEALLDEFASGYRVDPDRLLARLEAAGAGRPGAATARGASPWWARSGPLAAAAAVGVLVTGMAVLLRFDPPDRSTSTQPSTGAARTTAAPPSATTSAQASPTGVTSSAAPSATGTASASSRPTVTVTAGAPGTGAARTRQPSGPTSGRVPASPSVTPPGPGPAAGIAVAPLPARVSLGEGGLRDWVVVGGRRDAKQVRLKRGTGELVVRDLTGAAVVGSSPLTLGWSGGLPEQDRDGDRTWWCADSGGVEDRAVFGIRVESLPPGAVLTLLTGADGGGSAKVEARIDGGPLAQLRASAGRVTVTTPASAAGRALSVEVTPSGGSSVRACLAAVTLQ
ncbi:MAG: hypothetical protein U0Q15_20800 [Kineosporiaceae bacterium]